HPGRTPPRPESAGGVAHPLADQRAAMNRPERGADSSGSVGAIVLAGGRSSRFGRDKLVEPVGGRPLLDYAIDGVRQITEDIVVVTSVDGVAPVLPVGRVVRDREAFEGPLMAVAVGLGATTAERLIVVAGDMPGLVPAVLWRLVDALADGSFEVAVLEVDGPPATLPMALRRAAAEPAARRLVASGTRRLAALPAALASVSVASAVWRLDDPAGSTLGDIDTPDDLP
ncbi:MAG: molybdenum cofactor guanylyltransferase, partial [Candidatus Limnocylindrales bacterium]